MRTEAAPGAIAPDSLVGIHARPSSEVEAERWAAARLESWRLGGHLETEGEIEPLGQLCLPLG